MRKYANKIEETDVYRVLYIPRLDSLSNPIYGILFYSSSDNSHYHFNLYFFSYFSTIEIELRSILLPNRAYL